MVFSNNLLMGAAGQSTGYEIENSLRLDGTGDMSRTVASDGNLRTWTISFWLKRSTFGTNGGLGFNVGGTFVNASNRSIFRFHSSLSGGDDDWYWAERSGGAWREDQATTIMYRDPSAWSHYVCVWDTDGGTTPRARRYVNGVSVDSELKSGGTAVGANVDSGTNQAGTFQLFDQAGFPGREFEGYCAETHFVDGTALGPTSFGEYNNDGVWIPKAYSGSYGTNGFYLDFADSSDLGKDVSGNGNDFTSSGLATTDQMSDTPTLNFCTMNPLDNDNMLLSDGNLTSKSAANAHNAVSATFSIPESGTSYFEFTCDDDPSGANAVFIGVIKGPNTAQNSYSTDGYNLDFLWLVSTYNGLKSNGSGQETYGSGFSTGQVGMCAINRSSNKIWWGNATTNTWFASGDPAAGSNEAFSNLPATGNLIPIMGNSSTPQQVTFNFGQSGFLRTPPTGFKALSTANLATPSIKDGSAYFDASLWTGNDTDGRAITGYNFQPDWVWIKSRSGAYSHSLTDAVRGVGKYLQSNTSDPEVNGPGAFGSTLAFTSDGFTLDNGTSDNLYVNAGGETYVGWAWAANGAGSSNTDGDITSTVSANTTAGFSIVKYSGNGSDNQEIGHGLGLAPKMIFTKRLNASGNWTTYNDAVGINKVFYLNSTAVPASNTEQYRATPTSSVYTIGVGGDINNSSGTYVAYVFAEVEGYSSIGTYEANAATDGPFIYTGFKPAFVLIKNIDATEEWWIQDDAREPFNGGNMARLAPNSSAAEADNVPWFDFLSNGLKVRYNAGGINASGTHIYMAFAESPFGGNGVAPATAR